MPDAEGDLKLACRLLIDGTSAARGDLRAV
jgi:hypothetical protein